MDYMDMEDQQLVRELNMIASCESFGYDGASMDLARRLGFLGSAEGLSFSLESDEGQSDEHKLKADASEKMAHSQGKFEAHMAEAQHRVDSDVEDIDAHLAKLTPEQQKKLPVGKIAAILGGMIGGIKFITGMKQMAHDANPATIKAAVAAKHTELNGIIEKLKTAHTTNDAASLSTLKAQMHEVRASIKSTEHTGAALQEAMHVAGNPAVKAVAFVAVVAIHALIYAVMAKVIFWGFRKIKSMIGAD